MNKGDIILVPFPFSDLTGNKNRPALVLIESEDDVTVCFITTQLKLQSEYDIAVQPSDIEPICLAPGTIPCEIATGLRQAVKN